MPAFEIDTSGQTEDEQLTVIDIRWWAVSDLAVTGDEVWPVDLLALLALAGRLEEWRDGPVQGDPVEESTVPAS